MTCKDETKCETLNDAICRTAQYSSVSSDDAVERFLKNIDGVCKNMRSASEMLSELGSYIEGMSDTLSVLIKEAGGVK